MHYRNIGISILRDILAQGQIIYIQRKNSESIYYTSYIFFVFLRENFHRQKQDGFTILCHYDENFHQTVSTAKIYFDKQLTRKKKEKKESKNIKLCYNNNFLFQR